MEAYFPAEKTELLYPFYRFLEPDSTEKSVYATIHFDGEVL